MTRIELAGEISDDFDRILDHLLRHEADDPPSRIDEILHAISVLEYNPLIGRPARNGMRELVIGRQTHGYITLYRYIPGIDTVFVLAIRNQREAGYRHDGL